MEPNTIVIITISVIFAVGILLILFRRKKPGLRTSALNTEDAYQRCQQTLQAIVERYKVIVDHVTYRSVSAWQAPGKRPLYTVDGDHVSLYAGSTAQKPTLQIAWSQVTALKIEMRPVPLVIQEGHTGDMYRVNKGYRFFLILEQSVNTSLLDIQLPITGQPDVIDFAAHMVALAERNGVQVFTIGFENAPEPALLRLNSSNN